MYQPIYWIQPDPEQRYIKAVFSCSMPHLHSLNRSAPWPPSPRRPTAAAPARAENSASGELQQLPAMLKQAAAVRGAHRCKAHGTCSSTLWRASLACGKQAGSCFLLPPIVIIPFLSSTPCPTPYLIKLIRTLCLIFPSQTQGVLSVVCVLLPAGIESGREKNWISHLLISKPGSLESKVILQVSILRIGWRCFTGLDCDAQIFARHQQHLGTSQCLVSDIRTLVNFNFLRHSGNFEVLKQRIFRVYISSLKGKIGRVPWTLIFLCKLCKNFVNCRTALVSPKQRQLIMVQSKRELTVSDNHNQLSSFCISQW